MVEDNRQIRMMLVEDDLDSAISMLVMLKRRGVSVHHVASGEEAVRLFNPADYDVLVTDIRLGSMSGTEVLRAIREEHAHFPIVLITAYDNIGTAIEAVRLGADDYILKPLDKIEPLLESARRAVRRHDLIIENAALNERLHHLSSEILAVEEAERRNLAADLHDSVGQSLVLAKMRLAAAAAGAESERQKEALGDVLGLISGMISQIRTLIFNISPPILYDIGLEAALDSLVVQTQLITDIPIQCKVGQEKSPITRELSVVLFRAVRELLNNAVKYSKAKTITLSMVAQNGQVELSVEDDGVGFDAEAVLNYSTDRFGYGLFSIRERLKDYGGGMDINSRKGEGACIRLKAPMNAGKLGAAAT